MIINHTNRFACIHIPKCGGSSVRNVLDKVNEWSYFGNPWTAETEKLGIVNFAHLPLSALRVLFPEDLELVLKYESYAVVRNPYDRFFSSIQEKLKQDNMRIGVSKKIFTPEEIKREIKEVIEFLMKDSNFASGNVLPYTHTHFQRQKDYLFLDGVKVIKHVYCLGNLDSLFDSLQHQTGLQLFDEAGRRSFQKTNVSKRFRFSWVKMITESRHPFILSLKKSSPSILKNIHGKLFFIKSSIITSEARNPFVMDFIASYYKEDIELFESLCASGKSSKS